MAPVADCPSGHGPSFSFWTFLKDELAPRPGRAAAATRVAVGCIVVVALAMLFRLPLPAYMAYLVFLLSKEEAAATVRASIAGGLAVTVAVWLSLLLYMLDASDPVLRLPFMAAATFGGMWMLRVSAMGPVAFLASFVLVMSQTLIDRIPNTEAVTQVVLWLWVVAVVPAILTMAMDLTAGANPSLLARERAAGLLDGFASMIAAGSTAGTGRLQTDVTALAELRKRAELLDKGLKRKAGLDGELLEILAELLVLPVLLPERLDPRLANPLCESARRCAAALRSGDAVEPVLAAPDEGAMAALPERVRPVVVAVWSALSRICFGLSERRNPPFGGDLSDTVARDAGGPSPGSTVRDAISRGHVRFALKTTLAVMASYIVYSALDWPGISTAVTTCFFVALGSFGETMHKLTLRLGGAVIGGLIGAAGIVYLLPAMTDIAQLCLFVGVVAWGCAWVAAGSERLSYAGMQMAFAFFLGVLQDYGPATDLTVLRDRVAGILLGNFIMSLVFSMLWPVSALDQARDCVVKALHGMAVLMAEGTRGSRLAVLKAMGDFRKYVDIVPFERRLIAGGGEDACFEGDGLERLAASVFSVIEGDRVDGGSVKDFKGFDLAASDWFLDRARAAPARETGDGTGNIASQSFSFPAGRRAGAESRYLLQAEIGHAEQTHV